MQTHMNEAKVAADIQATHAAMLHHQQEVRRLRNLIYHLQSIERVKGWKVTKPSAGERIENQ